jgi:hypothetical protein
MDGTYGGVDGDSRAWHAILHAISCCGMKAYLLDTDVLVAAFRSDTGASRQVLEAARARRFDLLLSVPLMLEYESVLTRPEHLAASGSEQTGCICSAR